MIREAKRSWFTWDVLSNTAYLLGAILVAHGDGPTGYVFIATMAFLTVGSAGYHAGLPRWNHMDVTGIYAVGIVLYLVTIMGTTVSAAGTMVAVAVPGAYLLRMEQLDVRMEVKIAALFVVVYATAFMFHGTSQYLMASVGVMVVALMVRRYDHGVWHVTSAVGLALLWIGVTP